MFDDTMSGTADCIQLRLLQNQPFISVLPKQTVYEVWCLCGCVTQGTFPLVSSAMIRESLWEGLLPFSGVLALVQPRCVWCADGYREGRQTHAHTLALTGR